MGKIFGKCSNCGGVMIGTGTREGELSFCSDACQRYYHCPGFCESCLSQTSPEQVGGVFTFNLLLGTRLLGFGEHCSQCNSVIKRKWFFLILPLFPVSAKYRVLYLSRRRYYSRKLKIDLS